MSDGLVCVAYLYGAEVASGFHESILALLYHDALREDGPMIGDRIARFSGVNVSVGRNHLAKQFLEGKCEWLLTLDTDIMFSSDVIERLIDAAHPVTRPVVSGLYFSHKENKVFPQLYVFARDEDAPSKVQLVRLMDFANGLMQVNATGAGCMLIHRSVIEKIQTAGFSEAYPWYEESSYINGQPCSEDITFCLRAAQVGASVWVDTRIRLTHTKVYGIDEPLFRKLQEQSDADADGVVRFTQSTPALA